MERLRIPVLAAPGAALPRRSSAGAAGADLAAWLPGGSIVLRPGERALVPTGLRIALPEGYEAQIRPRSGLALKSGVTVLNSPGTIDSDYRGEVGVILANLGGEDFEIRDGDRIAQIVVSSHQVCAFEPVLELDGTGRGEGGFGSTGV